MSTSVRIPVDLKFADLAHYDAFLRSLCGDNPNCGGGPSEQDHVGCPLVLLISPDDVTLHENSISIKGLGDLKAKSTIPPRIEHVCEVYLRTDGDFSNENENFHVEFVVGA